MYLVGGDEESHVARSKGKDQQNRDEVCGLEAINKQTNNASHSHT